MKLHLRLACVVVGSLAIVPALSMGQQFGRGGRGLSMPHSMNDANGNQWMIYPGGWCQIQGNQPIYSQGAMLTINGQQPQGNQPRLDEKSGEVVFENMKSAGFSVT